MKQKLKCLFRFFVGFLYGSVGKASDVRSGERGGEVHKVFAGEYQGNEFQER